MFLANSRGFYKGNIRVEDPDHFDAELDPAFHLNVDSDPAFHLNVDPDPALHQSDANLRTLVYRTSRVQFWASTPPLWASTAQIWSSKASKFWLIWGSWSGSSFSSQTDPDPASKPNPNAYSLLPEEQENVNVSICRKLKEEKLEEEEDLVDKEEC